MQTGQGGAGKFIQGEFKEIIHQCSDCFYGNDQNPEACADLSAHVLWWFVVYMGIRWFVRKFK